MCKLPQVNLRSARCRVFDPTPRGRKGGAQFNDQYATKFLLKANNLGFVIKSGPMFCPLINLRKPKFCPKRYCVNRCKGFTLLEAHGYLSVAERLPNVLFRSLMLLPHFTWVDVTSTTGSDV